MYNHGVQTNRVNQDAVATVEDLDNALQDAHSVRSLSAITLLLSSFATLIRNFWRISLMKSSKFLNALAIMLD